MRQMQKRGGRQGGGGGRLERCGVVTEHASPGLASLTQRLTTTHASQEKNSKNQRAVNQRRQG